MSFSLRQIAPESKLSHHAVFHALHALYPPCLIAELLTTTKNWEKRERGLSMLHICYLILALSLFPRLNQPAIVRQLFCGLRDLWHAAAFHLPTKGAVSQRRTQLPILVLRTLFRRVCKPFASPTTPGAFYRDWRLVALDGTSQDVLETQANREHFGRNNVHCPFPQLRCVALVECATHAPFAVKMGPSTYSEEALSMGLTSALTPGMLLLMDRGFTSWWWVNQVHLAKAHLLARLTSTMLTHPIKILADGSYLATLLPPSGTNQAKRAITVRVIEYTFCDPHVPHAKEVHRLLTTFFDPNEAPALDLIDTYHERWAFENCLDEIKNHLNLPGDPLRGHTPHQVYQEVWGILLLHYAIRHLMGQSAQQVGLDPDRLSFTHAVEVLLRTVHTNAIWSDADQPALFARLLEDLRGELLPPRRLRFQSRAVKRCTSKYASKRMRFESYEPEKPVSFHHLVQPKKRILLLI